MSTWRILAPCRAPPCGRLSSMQARARIILLIVAAVCAKVAYTYTWRYLDAKWHMEYLLQAEARAAASMPPCLGQANQRVISFGLYGKSPRYIKNAIVNVHLGRLYFPGWRVRFYLDRSVPDDVARQLAHEGADLVFTEGGAAVNGTVGGMFWRFRVARDPCVAVYLIRDVDSHLSQREAAAVHEWLAARPRVPFYVIRDHPSHAEFAVNGGMWGGQAPLPSIEQLMSGGQMRRSWGDAYRGDMSFLRRNIWPLMKHYGVYQHDSFSCVKWGGKGLPLPRDGDEHIGAVFDAAGNMREADVAALRAALPEPADCRSGVYHPGRQ